jgi:hypothetical protein
MVLSALGRGGVRVDRDIDDRRADSHTIHTVPGMPAGTMSLLRVFR